MCVGLDLDVRPGDRVLVTEAPGEHGPAREGTVSGLAGASLREGVGDVAEFGVWFADGSYEAVPADRIVPTAEAPLIVALRRSEFALRAAERVAGRGLSVVSPSEEDATVVHLTLVLQRHIIAGLLDELVAASPGVQSGETSGAGYDVEGAISK